MALAPIQSRNVIAKSETNEPSLSGGAGRSTFGWATIAEKAIGAKYGDVS